MDLTIVLSTKSKKVREAALEDHLDDFILESCYGENGQCKEKHSLCQGNYGQRDLPELTEEPIGERERE